MSGKAELKIQKLAQDVNKDWIGKKLKMKNKVRIAKEILVNYLENQKEPEDSNRYFAEEEYWSAFNEAMNIAIEEVEEVLGRIEHDVEFKRG